VSASEQRGRWGNRGPVNFANQIAPVVGLAGHPPVAFPSRNVWTDPTSRLYHAQRHSQLHYKSIVNGDYDASGHIVFGKII
jgi:hypothetical protein